MHVNDSEARALSTEKLVSNVYVLPSSGLAVSLLPLATECSVSPSFRKNSTSTLSMRVSSPAVSARLMLPDSGARSRISTRTEFPAEGPSGIGSSPSRTHETARTHKTAISHLNVHLPLVYFLMSIILFSVSPLLCVRLSQTAVHVDDVPVVHED